MFISLNFEAQVKLHETVVIISETYICVPKVWSYSFLFYVSIIAVIKHRDRGNLEKLKFIWAYSSRRLNCNISEQSK